MRPVLCMLIAMCLMVTLAATAAENREVFPVKTDGVMPMVSMVVADDRLLITSSGAVYAYTLGAQEPVLLQQQPVTALAQDIGKAERFDVLMADNGRLYAFDLDNGRLYTAAMEAGLIVPGERIPLDLEDMMAEGPGYSYFERPDEMLVMDGFLYMITRDYTTDSQPKLRRFALATGAGTAFETPHINHMTAFRDGKLLVMLWDMLNGYDEQLGRQTPARLGLFDPETDSVQDLGELNGSEGSEGSLGYDAGTDTIYSIRRGRLYRRTPADRNTDELCGYFPSSYIWGVVSGAIVPFAGGVAVLTGDNLFIRDADPARLPASVLTVYGNYGDLAHRLAQTMMPDVPVELYDRAYYDSAQALGQALAEGDDTIDVYFLHYSFVDAKSLLNTLYAQDLSASRQLMDHANAVYPFLRDAGMFEGKLLMLPVDASIGEVMMAFPERFAEAGLAVPETFFDLISLISQWPGELARANPGMTPLQTETYRSYLFYTALSIYGDLRAVQGQELRFDDPLFRKMMTALEALDTRELDWQVDWDAPEERDAFYARRPLMENTGGVNAQYFQSMMADGMKLLPLAADEGEPAPVPFTLRVAAVNPRSRNIDQAVRYLENYVANLPGEYRVTMMPGANDPVPNPSFVQELEEMQAAKASYEAALAGAHADARTDMEGIIRELKDNIADFAATGRFIVSAEAIRAYRAHAGSGFLMEYSPVQTGMSDLNALYDQYLTGQMDLETLIDQCDAVLRLARPENQ